MDDDTPTGCSGCLPGTGRGAPARAAPRFGGGAPERVVWLDGGPSFTGCLPAQAFLPQDGEAPRRPVRLRPYGIEAAAVTNARFAAFVQATGYVTEAEEIGWSFVFQDFMPADVARTAQRPVAAPWWLRVDGAAWATPEGPGSGWQDRADHPVVHLSWRDARAFAAWVGGRLPSEAEWEHAARGGGDDRFPWGDAEPDDEGFQPCNIWQGRFPERNLGLDGFAGTAPVDAFAPNGFGLFNMVGNAWEWCGDRFRIRSLSSNAKARNRMAEAQGQRVMKGGSYLCHKSYCYRYRIAARQGCPPDSATGHAGMRIAYDPPR